jgi:hypothetical protein
MKTLKQKCKVSVPGTARRSRAVPPLIIEEMTLQQLRQAHSLIQNAPTSDPLDSDHKFWCLFGVYYWSARQRIYRKSGTIEKVNKGRNRSEFTDYAKTI